MQTDRKSDRSSPPNGLLVLRAAADDRNGFTLIELMIVVTIVMVLSMAAMGSFNKIRNNAKIYRCMGEIRGIEKEISAWATEKGSYPASLADLPRGIVRDPWGNNYIYTVPTREFVFVPINTDFDLYSKGTNADSVASIDDSLSEDDIIRGRDGSYVGLAINY